MTSGFVNILQGDATRIPKAVLHQLCQRSGWDPPKFDKVGKKGSGFSYCVSVVRKSTGRGKNRRSGGLITLQLPGQDESFNSSEVINYSSLFQVHDLI